MGRMSQPSPRVVQLTPPGRGAVATLMVEGPGGMELVEKRFLPADGRPLSCFPIDRLVFGRFRFDTGTSEEMVVRCRSERSVELHCHGGHAAVTKIEQTLVEEGCAEVSWQQWLGQRHDDPFAAAAQAALADARTERTAAILLDQFNGALSFALQAIRESLQMGNIGPADRQIKELLSRGELGLHLVEPWRVVLAGCPNVGKSSLINALVGYQRAIVHWTAGTTRDVVSAITAVQGWPIELSDTAGLDKPNDSLQQAGVALTRRQLASADLVILVFDLSQPWTNQDRQLAASWPNALIVHNKSDLAEAPGLPRAAGLKISAATRNGVDELVDAIAKRLVPNPPPVGAAVPFTSGQIARLQAASEALPDDPNRALAALDWLP